MSEEYASFEGKVNLDLHEKWDTAEEAEKGGVKTFTPSPDGGLIFDSGKSDYVVTVERVLGVDGWEKTTEDEGDKTHRQLMTLIILKIVVTRKNANCRVRSVTATLSFENQKTGPKANPVIEAWAPFREIKLTGATTSQITQTDQTSGKGGVASHGANVSAERSRTTEIAFERTYYDMAYATPRMNRESNQRGGVMWYMERNEVQRSNPPPETYAAVLFSRDANAPYVVNFDIDVRGGTTYDASNKLKRMFGLGPGYTRPFLVKPSPGKPMVRGGEGRDFLLAVDGERLGSLRDKDDSTGLNIMRRSGKPLAAQEGMWQGVGPEAEDKSKKAEGGGDDFEEEGDEAAEEDDAWGG
ncbi:hypothetical protein EDB80DRAFT_248761 [Ilyonectria destructans]|nr:hypothetical protein EDB80DRAFT_248761 [Ilyonectria destructans]